MSRATESAIHKAILAYLRLRFPRALVVHAANEMNIAADARSKAIAQARAKKLGMMPGWPDLQLLLPEGEALFFEVKSEGGRVSEAQKGVLAALARLGFRAAVVRSVRDVEECLSEWDVDGVEAWEMSVNAGENATRALRNSTENARDKSGSEGAGNTTRSLTIGDLMRRSRDGC